MHTFGTKEIRHLRCGIYRSSFSGAIDVSSSQKGHVAHLRLQPVDQTRDQTLQLHERSPCCLEELELHLFKSLQVDSRFIHQLLQEINDLAVLQPAVAAITSLHSRENEHWSNQNRTSSLSPRPLSLLSEETPATPCNVPISLMQRLVLRRSWSVKQERHKTHWDMTLDFAQI